MSGKVTPEALAKKVQSQKDRFERLEKEVRTLKDILNVHDNWNAEIRNYVGKLVHVRTVDGGEYEGVLHWSDRYNLKVGVRVFNKGGIIWLEPV